MSRDSRTVLSLFHIHPVRIDATAMFARALSAELDTLGFRSVLCFPSEPPLAVRDYLSLPNVTIEVDPALFDGRFNEIVRSFFGLARRHRPSIVHIHFMGLISPFPWLARTLGVRQFIFTDHSSRPEAGEQGLSPGWKRLLKAALYHPIDRVVAVSDYVLQSHLTLRHLPPARVRLISNGIDLERVATAMSAPQNFRASLGIPADCVLITQVSWLIEQKGVADFVEAAKLVIAACPSTHFCLVGTGPCLEEQRKAVAAAGIESHFTFAGEMSDPFFDGVFAASDIICQPSRWNEAFGWVIGEAMAFGKPLVATRAGAIPEVVRHGVTGYLVERRNPLELSRRLIELASDPALRKRMGAAAFREVGERFPLNRNIRQHLVLYGLLPDTPEPPR